MTSDPQPPLPTPSQKNEQSFIGTKAGPSQAKSFGGSCRGKEDHRLSREVWSMERKEKARERRVNKVSQNVWWKEKTRSGTAGRAEGQTVERQR